MSNTPTAASASPAPIKPPSRWRAPSPRRAQPTALHPGGAISLVYAGAIVLAASVLTLAVGLFRAG